MKKNNLLPLLSLILTGIFVFLSLYPSVLPLQRVLFTFFFLYLVIVPGMLLSRRLVPAFTGVLGLLSSLVFGTTLVFCIFFVAALLRLDSTIIRFVIPAVVVPLALYPVPPVENGTDIDGRRAQSLERRHVVMLLILIALAAILILGPGDPVLLTGDSPDHIAYIGAVSRSHEAFPEEFYYRDGGILTRDIRRGMLHSLWGTINALTGNGDAYRIWPLISLFGSIFFIIAIFCSGILLFRSGATGLIAAALFLLIDHGGIATFHLIYLAMNFSFGRIFYLSALSVLPLYLRSGNPRYLVFVLAASVAATSTHIAHFIILIFLTCVVILVHLVSRRRSLVGPGLTRLVLLVPAAVLIVNLPYILLRYFRDYSPANLIHTHIQGVMYLTKKLYTLNPVVFIQEAGSLGILAAVAIPVLWKTAKRNRTLMLLFAAQITYYLLIFIPFLFPLLHERLSYLLIRMEFVAPSMVISAFLMHELWGALRGKRIEMPKSALVIGLLAVLILAILPFADGIRHFAYSGRNIEKLEKFSSLNLADVYQYLNDNLEDGGVVLSDPVTSYSIPAFTRQFVVCPYDQHSTPNDSSAIDRLIDCRAVFSPSSSPGRIADVMKKYEATYILINGRIPRTLRTMYWRSDSALNDILNEKLDHADGVFEKLYENDSATLFMVRPGMTVSPKRGEGPPLFVGGVIEAGEMQRLPDSGMPGIKILEFGLDRRKAKRGERIEATVKWVATEPLPFRSYITHIRFDTRFEKSAVYNRSYGKIYRKVLERMKKTSFRFRADNQPFAGIFAPDLWPVGREIENPISIDIPSEIASGLYVISVRMAEKPHYPNYYLKDILVDEDYFSGTVVGEIEIE